VDLFDRSARRPAAVLVTRDGRCVTMPIDEISGPQGSLWSLVVFVLGLIGGSRWEPGGTRRSKR